VTEGDWRFVAEAEEAGRDTGPFLRLWKDALDRRERGLTTTRAERSTLKAWKDLCAVSRGEVDMCRKVLAAWADDDKRRLRHIAKVRGRINRRMAWYPAVVWGRSVHWEARQMLRWVHLVGADGQLAERKKQKEEAAMRRKGKPNGPAQTSGD
jgi:hypothetical protein